MRTSQKQDERELANAKKFNKQLQLDNQQIEVQMNRLLKGIQKNKDGASSTDLGSKDMSTMMTNLDASNQQLLAFKEKQERAREQMTQHEEKLSELETKYEKLQVVAANYGLDLTKIKEYLNANKVTKVAPDRV